MTSIVVRLVTDGDRVDMERHVKLAKVFAGDSQVEARITRNLRSAQVIEPMHMREVEILHRISSAAIRYSIEEPTEPGRDLALTVPIMVLDVVALGSLEHEKKNLFIHLTARECQVWQPVMWTPSSLRLWEKRGVLVVASDEDFWIQPNAAWIAEPVEVLMLVQATSFTLDQEIFVYNDFT